MPIKRKSVFAEQEAQENAKRRQSVDTLLSNQIGQLKNPDNSLRLKAIKFTSAHVNYASSHILIENITPILEHQLWEENLPQLAQHIIKLLADIAVQKNISEDNTALSIVEILHKYLEAHQFSDDFITTQIVSSLIYIAQEKSVFRKLESVLALNILCTNKISLRVKLLNLLAVTTESKNSENGGSGCIVFDIFEGFTKDPFPSARKAALDGLVSLHRKGYQLTKGCYRRAVVLFQDKDELVKLSAIKVVCHYVEMLHQIEKGNTTYQINQAFLQLCTLSRDMNMKVRSEALEALGGMGPTSERVLLQALSKKILGKSTKKASTGTIQGDNDLTDCGKELDLLALSAAGAFLHGVEDEFSEVRMATIHSLAKLSGFSEQFADGALDLLMDMLNDDSLEVRMHTLHGLFYMAQIDHLTVEEKHMHMFLGMLEDNNADIRSATRRVLGRMKLPNISIFKMSTEALVTNLDKNPQDEIDIISVMYNTGKIHSTFVVCCANEFVQQIITYSNGELGLDHPHLPALLMLLLAAQISNVGICFQIPKKVVSYVNYFHVKFGITLFGSNVITKVKNTSLEDCQRSSDNNNCDGLLASSEVPNWEYGNKVGQGRHQNFGSETNESIPQFMDLEFPNYLLNFEASSNITDMPEKRQHKGHSQHKSEILCSAADILKVVAGTWSLLKQKSLVHIFKILRECREALQKLERNFEDSISVISFASLYIRSIHFVVKLQANLMPTSCQHVSQSGVDSSRRILENFGKVVRRMRNCFFGLSEVQELRILELNGLLHILRLSLLGVNIPSYILRRLSSLISRAELLCKGDGVSHSSFLWRIKKQLSDEDSKSICFLKLVQELPEHFSLQPIPLGEELKEIRAVLVVPNNSYERPFRFVSAMPLGITVHVTLHHVTSECRIWLAMVLGDSVQYNLIDVDEFQGLGGVKRGRVTMPFYSTVKIASCFLEVSVVMECPFDYGRVLLNTCQPGPKGDLLLLSNVEKVNLVASV